MTTEPAHFAPANTVAADPGGYGGASGAGGADGNAAGAAAAAAAAALPRVGKRGAPQAFARKLFEILTTESHAVIAWNDDGTAFHVKDVESFSEETLTKYYRHSKFSSFQRQLNLYSFRKIVKGPDAGGYAHPMFRRDKPDDLYHVRRSISGSSRYEPPATQVSSVSTGKGAASAARRNAGRAGAKATAGSEWAPSRAHKSGGAARRVGKLRLQGGARSAAAASAPARRADHRRKQQRPPAAAAASIPAQAENASAGERSPWTSGESSDSDVSIKDAARGGGKQQQPRRQRQQQQQQQRQRTSSSDESDSDLSDAEQRDDETNEQDQEGDEEEGREEEEEPPQQQQQQQEEQEEGGGMPERRTSRATAGLMAAWRRGESSLGGGDATRREQQQRSRRFSCAAAAEKEAGEGTAAAAVGSNGGGLKKGGSGEGQEQGGAPASPARKSPFNFFKKTFSFMERSSSHGRGLSTSSVDINAPPEQAEPSSPSPTTASSSSSASPLMVDTSASARAAAAGVPFRPPPVTVSGGRLTMDHATAAGSKVLTSSPLTPKSSMEAAAMAQIATAAAAAMPPPPKRDQREELGLVEQLTNMVEVFDICDLLRKVSTSNSSRLDKHGGIVKASAQPQHLRNMSVDTDQGMPQSPQDEDGQSSLGSLASMELVRDSSRDWDTLMAGSADVSDLGNTMVQSVAEFFSF